MKLCEMCICMCNVIIIHKCLPSFNIARNKLRLSNYYDSIHYHDSLRLLMNKIADCWTIRIVLFIVNFLGYLPVGLTK